MSTDIERLLAAAADDSDRPLHTDVDDILVRARRSVRRSRIATVSTAVVTTAAIIGGIAAWSTTRTDSAGPAGTPKGQTITVDAKTGRIVDNETGKTVTPAPPLSPLSDAEIHRRCAKYDHGYEHSVQLHKGSPIDKAGPVDARWKVVVKSGDQSVLNAIFLSPDKSVVSTCAMAGPEKPESFGRTLMTEVSARSQLRQPMTAQNGLAVPVAAGVTRVLVDLAGESSPREALVGADGFFTLGHPDRNAELITVNRIRGYDAGGTKVYDHTTKPFTPPAQPTVDPSVTVKTAEPITPQVVLTKDPQTGKALAPPPPVSPLTDDQITTRCRGVDDIYFKDSASANSVNPVIKAAGPVTSSWKVALKTGTGNKLTAVLVSPDHRVFAWCHMLAPTAKGAYDYSRGAVQANGKFADRADFGMVPDGVAQIVVDLPQQGPTRALISSGYYIWGLTGGNSGIKNVRVRGFDAQGKQVYDAKKDVDADFD